jgi:hypothetical protein
MGLADDKVPAVSRVFPGKAIDYDVLLIWEHYVYEMTKKGIGCINPRYQFRDYIGLFKILMREWTREEVEDGEGPTKTGKHTANQFTTYVDTLTAQGANEVGVLVAVAKLAEPAENSSLNHIMIRWFEVGAGEWGDTQVTWTTDQDRTHQVHTSIPKGGTDQKSYKIHPSCMKARFLHLSKKFL